MQIGNPLIRSYDNNIQAGSRTEQMKGAEQTGQVNNRTDISGLSEGSVFRGEITDISGERVTIATENKGEIAARLQADMELNIGDRMLFSVKENTTSQILIKPMFDSLYSAQTQVLERALDGAGLSATEKNFSAAKELMEAGMSLDKANMVKLLSQSMKFEGTSMHTLAALNKMNIPVTAENIAQYERYESLNHQLLGDISQTAEGMADFANAFPANMEGSELLSVAKELVNIFQSESESAESVGNALENEAATGEAGNVEEGKEQASATGKQGEAVKTETFVENSALTDKGASDADATMDSSGVTDGNKEGQNNASVINQSNGEVLNDTEAGGTSAKLLSDSLLENVVEKTNLSKEEVSNLVDQLKRADVPNEQIKQLLNESGDSGAMLKSMLDNIKASENNDSAVRNLMKSSEFKKLFTDMVKKEFALNPNEMKDPKEIDDLYNKILKQTEKFENTISAKGGDAGSFQQNSQNMHQNMQFIQDLNNQMIYAQMPLKLSNQNANSELFVYADKRKLAGKRDDISVMLHLDMDHLGATDVKVTLTGTNVNARFYLNDQESVNIIADNMNQLAAKLTERGFSLTNEVVMRKPAEAPNKVVNEFVDGNAEKSIKRFTFDART